MAWQVTPYTVPLVAATLVSAALTVYAAVHLYTREYEPSVAAFCLLLAGVTLYALGYTLTLSSVELVAKRRWLRVLWTGAAIVPTGWLLFAITYAERESWLTRPRLALLTLQPAGTVALLLSGHPTLIWSDFQLDTTSNPFATVEFALGPWYQFSLLYSWLLTVAGLVVLVWFVVRSDDLYRGQAAVLVFGGLAPFVGSLAFFSGLNPHPNVNPTSAAFAVSGMAFAVAVFRYRFLDIVPVATDTVVERMRDGYVVLDDGGQILDANPAAAAFAGTDQFVGEPAAAVFPFDLPLSGSVTDGGPEQVHELTFEVGDETRFLEVRETPLPGARRAGCLLLLRDVTAQRRVERRYQRLIERASDIIVVLDAAATVQYQSPSIRRVLGHDPALVEGANAFELVHPDDRERVQERFDDIVDAPGTTERIEYRVRHADGEWRTIETIVKNLLEDPYVEGIVLNGRDVTEHRERERELERQNERLDEFAGLVSHDLRNPLQVADASAHLAETDGDAEHFERLHGALDRMDRIIDDVLTLAREGQAIRTTERVALDAIADRAWETVSTDAATFSTPESTMLDADPDRLQQLFENLFRNAVEHGSTAPASRSRQDPAETVTVTVAPLADHRGFSVADDGPGIPPDERDRVFESGYTTADDGTGFGLAIVREIADGHGWTPTVTESEDGGARFEFRIE
jgi:PAS domain S-box-containing protein